MSQPARRRMNVDEFLHWAQAQPGRYELVAGEVVAMVPERARRNLVKGEAFALLREEVRRRGLPCQVFTDGMTVRIDEVTAFQPDVVVRCGEPLPPESVEVPDPLVVVEVVSPSSQTVDSACKLHGYLHLPSVRHYLIVDPAHRTVVHHERTGSEIRTCILHGGMLDLDPPGVRLDLDALFTA